MNQYGYGGSSGSFTVKDGITPKDIDISIIPQVENYYEEKFFYNPS